MTMLTPVGGHELLLLLRLQLVVLLVVARSLGLLVQRFHQPRVVGELVAGVLIDRSVAGRHLPDLVGRRLPVDTGSSALLQSVASVVLLLLLASGTRTNLDLLRRIRRPAACPSGAMPSRSGPGRVGWVMPVRLGDRRAVTGQRSA